MHFAAYEFLSSLPFPSLDRETIWNYCMSPENKATVTGIPKTCKNICCENTLYCISSIRHIYHINPVLLCPHLPSFIRLVDFLVVDTLYILVANAVAKLLSVLKEQVQHTPSHDVIQSWSQHCEVATDTTKEEMDKKVGHSFTLIIIVLSIMVKVTS